MVLFVELARTQNFSKAALKLGVPASTLSRRIGAMEKRLGLRLFERSTRQVTLTEVARAHYERCANLIDQARLAEEELRTTAAAPSGTVRLTAPVDLGQHWVGPLLPDLLRRFPGIALVLDLSPRHADLASERFDIALRIGEVRAPQLVCRTLGELSQGLFAAPQYLARHGHPQHTEDLARHTCLLIGDRVGAGQWRLTRAGQPAQEVPVNTRLSLNNVGLMRQMLEGGAGIGALPLKLAREAVAAARLVAVLPDYRLPVVPVRAVTSSRLQPAAVRAVLQFLADQLTWD